MTFFFSNFQKRGKFIDVQIIYTWADFPRPLINCNSIEIRTHCFYFGRRALPLSPGGDRPPVFYNRGAVAEMVSSPRINSFVFYFFVADLIRRLGWNVARLGATREFHMFEGGNILKAFPFDDENNKLPDWTNEEPTKWWIWFSWWESCLKLIFTRSLFFHFLFCFLRGEDEAIRHPGSTPSLSVYILAFSLYRRQHPITSVWGHNALGKCPFGGEMDTIRFSLAQGMSCPLFMALVWNPLFGMQLLIGWILSVRYTKQISGIGIGAQKYNAEVRVSRSDVDSHLVQLSDRLRHVRQVSARLTTSYLQHFSNWKLDFWFRFWLVKRWQLPSQTLWWWRISGRDPQMARATEVPATAPELAWEADTAVADGMALTLSRMTTGLEELGTDFPMAIPRVPDLARDHTLAATGRMATALAAAKPRNRVSRSIQTRQWRMLYFLFIFDESKGSDEFEINGETTPRVTVNGPTGGAGGAAGGTGASGGTSGSSRTSNISSSALLAICLVVALKVSSSFRPFV